MQVIDFIQNLTLVKGNQYAGKPFTLRPWQQQWIEQLYGTLRPDGLRQYRTCFNFLPRKNAKTTVASALLLHHIVCDEQGAEANSIAKTKEQASIIFDIASKMVKADPVLSRVLKVYDSTKRIVCNKTNSFYKALACDSAGSLHGLNCSFLVVDEASQITDDELYYTLISSMGSRQQPLTLITTSAGWDRQSLGYNFFEYSRNLQNNLIHDETFLPVLFYLDEKEDWQDKNNWYKANPALADFRELDEFEQAYKNAINQPSNQNYFRSLYLNQWCQQNKRWLDLNRWISCGKPITIKDFYGKSVIIGIDLASTTDLTAMAVYQPDSKQVIPYHFVPESICEERERTNKQRFNEWIEQGHMTQTIGNVCDYGFIEKEIDELAKHMNISTIVIDPRFATQMATNLMSKGYHVQYFYPSFTTMNGACRELEKMLLNSELAHDNNPCATWQVNNVVVEMNSEGMLRPARSKSTEKIDFVCALLYAIGVSMKEQQQVQPELLWF
jgi:phage terminase large subunit-like protein